jgi:hypothetical protein
MGYGGRGLDKFFLRLIHILLLTPWLVVSFFFRFMPAKVGEGDGGATFDDQHRYRSAALLEGRSSPDNPVAGGCPPASLAR